MDFRAVLSCWFTFIRHSMCLSSLCYHPLLFTARYFFPRQLLIPHFWTPRQQVEFQGVYHSLRVRHHWPVLKGLEYTSLQVKDNQLQSRLKDLCAKVSEVIENSVLLWGKCGRIGCIFSFHTYWPSVLVLPAINCTIILQIFLNIIIEHTLMHSLYIRWLNRYKLKECKNYLTNTRSLIYLPFLQVEINLSTE